MSALLPIFPGDLERWARPRPEPVELALEGWTREVIEPNTTFPNERSVVWRKGEATLTFTRWWDTPRNPGPPIVVVSRRALVVAGRQAERVDTPEWIGVWLRGEGHEVKYLVRLVFHHVDERSIDDALSRITIAW